MSNYECTNWQNLDIVLFNFCLSLGYYDYQFYRYLVN